MKIINRVRELRLELGMDRSEFAAALDFTTMCLSNYENNLRNPSIEMAYRMIALAKTHGKNKKLEDIFPDALTKHGK